MSQQLVAGWSDPEQVRVPFPELQLPQLGDMQLRPLTRRGLWHERVLGIWAWCLAGKEHIGPASAPPAGPLH